MKRLVFACFLVVSIVVGCGAPARAQEGASKQKLNVAILIFDGVQIVDYTGPYEVLGSGGRRNVYTVAEKPDVITTAMGMRVVPNYTFANQPRPDIIVVPGGGNSGEPAARVPRGVGAQLNNEAVIRWIRESAAQSKYVMSVCNGAFLLAKAGLLDGLSATTTAGYIDYLATVAPKTKVVYDQRYVDNGKVITTGGLSAGIDGAMRLIEKLDGAGRQEVTLREELEFLELYLGIQQKRFPDRLRVEMSVEPTALEALVPNLILQPLVENAIRHGVSRRAAAGTVGVAAAREGGRLRIRVYDDGPGLRRDLNGNANTHETHEGSSSGGIGLSNTRARLRQLYGDAQSFEVSDRAAGGVEASLSLPFRRGAASPSSVALNEPGDVSEEEVE